MMDASQVREIADRHLPKMMWQMQLNMWKVDVLVEVFDGRGKISVQPQYEKATMTINPEENDSEAEVVEVLRHELFHLFHAEFWTYRNMMMPHLTPETFDSFDDVFHVACEKMVLRAERMFEHGLGSPDHMVVHDGK